MEAIRVRLAGKARRVGKTWATETVCMGQVERTTYWSKGVAQSEAVEAGTSHPYPLDSPGPSQTFRDESSVLFMKVLMTKIKRIKAAHSIEHLFPHLLLTTLGGTRYENTYSVV